MITTIITITCKRFYHHCYCCPRRSHQHPPHPDFDVQPQLTPSLPPPGPEAPPAAPPTWATRRPSPAAASWWRRPWASAGSSSWSPSSASAAPSSAPCWAPSRLTTPSTSPSRCSWSVSHNACLCLVFCSFSLFSFLFYPRPRTGYPIFSPPFYLLIFAFSFFAFFVVSFFIFILFVFIGFSYFLFLVFIFLFSFSCLHFLLHLLFWGVYVSVICVSVCLYPVISVGVRWCQSFALSD